MLKKQKTEKVVKGNRQLPTGRKDQFFDFNMIDGSKSNYGKKIDFLGSDLSDYRKIT